MTNDEVTGEAALHLENLICGENRLEFSVAAGQAVQTVTLKDAAIFVIF